jgi:membrane associated rhomboid family serine protease
VNAATEAYLIVVVILALIGGVLALVLRNSVVVVSTAFNGALAMMFGVYALLTRRSPGGAVQALRQFGTDAWIVLALTAVLGSIGGYVQFCTLPKQKPQVMYKKVKKQQKAD